MDRQLNTQMISNHRRQIQDETSNNTFNSIFLFDIDQWIRRLCRGMQGPWRSSHENNVMPFNDG